VCLQAIFKGLAIRVSLGSKNTKIKITKNLDWYKANSVLILGVKPGKLLGYTTPPPESDITPSQRSLSPFAMLLLPLLKEKEMGERMFFTALFCVL